MEYNTVYSVEMESLFPSNSLHLHPTSCSLYSPLVRMSVTCHATSLHYNCYGNEADYCIRVLLPFLATSLMSSCDQVACPSKTEMYKSYSISFKQSVNLLRSLQVDCNSFFNFLKLPRVFPVLTGFGGLPIPAKVVSLFWSQSHLFNLARPEVK